MNARKIEFTTVEWTDEKILNPQKTLPIVEKVPLIIQPEQQDIDDLYFFFKLAIQSVIIVLLTCSLLMFFHQIPALIALGLSLIASISLVKFTKSLIKKIRTRTSLNKVG